MIKTDMTKKTVNILRKFRTFSLNFPRKMSSFSKKISSLGEKQGSSSKTRGVSKNFSNYKIRKIEKLPGNWNVLETDESSN